MQELKIKISQIKYDTFLPYDWKSQNLTVLEIHYTEDGIPVYVVKQDRRCCIISGAIVVGMKYRAEYLS